MRTAVWTALAILVEIHFGRDSVPIFFLCLLLFSACFCVAQDMKEIFDTK